MKGMEIVWNELKLILRSMVPLSLISFGVFVLCGYSAMRTAVSLIIGAAYTCFWFLLVGKNAVKSIHFSPERATKVVQRGYLFRYALTGVFVLCAIKIEFLYAVATVLPLFFPKIFYLLSNIFRKNS